MEWMKKKYWIILLGIVGAAIVFLAVRGGIKAAEKKTNGGADAFPVHINEVLTSNDSYPNADGVCCDFIELYNDSDRKVSLDGYQLGDKKSGGRYTIPDGTTIAPHGYLLVYCSKDVAGPYYAAFGLSRNGGEDVYFLNPRSVVLESVRTVAADKDVSQGYDEAHQWGPLRYVTPGYPNTREGYQSWAETHTVETVSDVLISEVMASNSIYPTLDGECTDWIELYNASDAAVRLGGFGLSDDCSDPVYLFPEDVILEAGAYLVVPCAQTGENAAHFGLSKAGGEDVTLFTANGTVADMVHTVPTEQNQSYARTADGWDVTFEATPGYPNTPEGRAAYVETAKPADAEVHITEIMASNKSFYADATGLFHDWIELSNTGDAACTLSGWFLSDDGSDPTQWKLPDCTLQAGGSLVVFFAGNRDGVIGGELFAPMALSAAGDTVYLVDPLGEIREQITFGPMDENRSLVIDPASGEQTLCVYPTPGFPDTADGYAAFCERLVPKGPLAIWEVMTANDKYLSQSGEYYDWLEIKNISAEPVNLGAYAITDDSKHPDRYVLPDVTLAPGAFYIVILSGHTEYSNKRYEHANFALNAQEDDLFLFENGELIDYVRLYKLPYRSTYGRIDGEGGFFYMTPTPGKENESGFRMISADPTASLSSGVYNGVSGIDVTLEGNGTIYYTTDGSDPDRNAKAYTGPIHLDQTTVLRSVAYEPDKKESGVVTCSYLINETHDLPVVSLVTDPQHLWDPSTGIYVDGTNRKEIEYPASAAYFGPDGTWEQECGIKMHGLTSLMWEDKKSFTLKFSGIYGGPLHFDVFGDGRVTVFKSVILRADAESTYSSFLRDNLLHTLAKRYSTSMLSQNSRHVVLYLNGKYWGIYAIREQYTPFFYASNMGVAEDSVLIAKNFVRGGTGLAEAVSYVPRHNMADAENYRYVTDRIDVSSFIDWMIFEAYCGNRDIEGNMRFLYSSEDGKWRCGLVDVDLGFFSSATIVPVFNAPQIGSVLRLLCKNESFRKQFLTRTSELLHGGLSEENVTALIDELAAEIRSEIPNEAKRWGGPKNWENIVEALKRYVHEVNPKLIASIRSELRLTQEEISTYFGDLLS